MDQERMQYFRSLLLKEKKELEKQLSSNQHFNLDRSYVDSTGELSSYDNHPADAGTETFERAKDLALNSQAETYLADINAALKKIEQGTYGICERCGQPISEARLEVVPTAKYCIKHQQEVDEDTTTSRPIEETILNPPFGRFDYDHTDHETQFDAEDAWQSVEKFGTSDTPDTYGNGKDNYNELYIESDEPVGYVEAVEGFISTDLEGGAGVNYDAVRNQAYERYVERNEGEKGNSIGD